MQLQDFKRIKLRRGMKNCFCFFPFSKQFSIFQLTFESSHQELFCKKSILRCAFAKEFEVFWIVQSRGTLTKLGALRSSHRRCSVRKVVLRNFANFTGKHLCQSLFFNKIADLRPATLFRKRLWHRCFPVNFVKFLRTPFYRISLGDCSMSFKICLFPWDIDMF